MVISIIGGGWGERGDGIVAAAFMTMVGATLAGESEHDTNGEARGHERRGRNRGRVFVGNVATGDGSGTCSTCPVHCGR